MYGHDPNGRGMAMATILYGRVSTIEQTADHQLTQAKAAGFKINEAVFDNGTTVSAPAWSNGPRDGGYSTNCRPATC